MMSDTVTCATYNILHGYHRDLVLNNIRFLAEKGADVICLQEAEVDFEENLQKFIIEELSGWQMRSAHAGFGGNVAILWKENRLTLTRTELIRLPKLRVPSRLQRLTTRRLKHLKKMNTDRAALVGYFETDGMSFQIASAHVAWEGGSRHRMRQIRFLRETLEKAHADVRIIAGDFNTLAFRTKRRRAHEKRVEEALGARYVNALPNLAWSHDTSVADPGDGLGFLPALHRRGVTFRSRLDYIFGSGVSVISGEMHDLPGSDHRPLVATFSPALAEGK